MAEKSLEERVAALEKDNQMLKREVERAKAVGEIQNVMSRYEYYHSVLDGEKETECFAHHTPGTRIEMGFGVYEGFEGVKRFYSMERPEEFPAGSTVHHTLTTPIIEVAGDGKTAKAAWISPCEETRVGPDGKVNAMFGWMKYGCDFVKEDGEWKIWHLIPYHILTAKLDLAMRDPDEKPREMPKPDNWDEVKPDRPPTKTGWSYSPTAHYPNDQPWPPVPYETWDDSMSYVP